MVNRVSGFVALAVLGAVLAGCGASRPLVLIPLPATGQVAGLAQGRQVFISRSETSGVGLSLPGEPIAAGKPVDLRVAVSNYSRKPFDFSSGHIDARCGGKNIQVYGTAGAVRDEELKPADGGGESSSEPAGNGFDFLHDSETDSERPAGNGPLSAPGLLQPETVLPNGIHTGVVRMSFPSCVDTVRVSITTGMDSHLFMFELSP